MKILIALLVVTSFLLLPAVAEAGRYTVQDGDTWSSIAASHGISMSTLAKANGIRLSLMFKTLPAPGDTIEVPSGPPPVVRKRCWYWNQHRYCN